MVSLVLLWMLFGGCALLILFAGPKLTQNAEIIADRRGLSDDWVGLILLASITSLPELAAGISSIRIAHAPEIAVGAVFGSCVFNLLMLVVLDFAVRGESVYRQARQAHILSASFGIMMIGFAGLTVMVGGMEIGPQLGSVSVASVVILVLYVIATRAIYNYEATARESAARETAETAPERTLSQAQKWFAISAAAILIGGILLPVASAGIADRTELGRGLVGTIFVAAATSLPELAVSFAALRQGAVNMAIANLLGSNLFNILILAAEDVVYTDAPILETASKSHSVTAMAAVVMTGVVIAGLLYRPKTRLFRTVGWTSIALFTIYLLNAYVMFLNNA